jgi:hypothetical protein
MVGELIMLPVRVGVRVTRLWLRAAEETTSLAISATQRLAGVAGSGGSGRPGGIAGPRPGSDPFEAFEPEPTEPERTRLDPTAAERPSPPARESETPLEAEPQLPAAPTPPAPPDRPLEPEPAHVSEEPALVEEFAEPGAEDGAGAEIHFQEPWDGYADMKAKQILARLNSATPAELAAVQLYETSHRSRQTILNTVKRELRRANGSGTRSQ